jgi:hypothetical protein
MDCSAPVGSGSGSASAWGAVVAGGLLQLKEKEEISSLDLLLVVRR